MHHSLRSRLPTRTALAVALPLLAGLSCGLLEDSSNSDCGPAVTDTWDLRQDTTDPPWQNDLPVTGIASDGRRYFIWDKTFTDLCVAADESGNSARFDVGITPGQNQTTLLTMEGRVYAAIGFEPYKIVLPRHTDPLGVSVYSGTVTNIGLRQGSLDGKTANIVVELYASMPASTPAVDLAIAEDAFKEIVITTKYRPIK